MTSNEVVNELDSLWVKHTVPGDNQWDNWRRYGRAVAAAEREAVLAACALEGVTVADVARIVQERSRS